MLFYASLACLALVGLFAVSADASGADDAKPVVELDTTKGKIVIELDKARAPITVENFLSYVDKGHYDGTIFHRVIPGFMVQGGGFSEAMREKPTGKGIKNESRNGLSNARGTLAMARTSDPDSATAQFFINVADNKPLDTTGGGYAVFGRVTEGMNVVDAIVGVPTKSVGPHDDVPVEPIVIKSAKRKGK